MTSREEKGRIREFLYVDIERVRSMLAQLSEGVPEAVTRRVSHLMETEGGAKIAGIGGTAGFGRESGREESRSLQDLTFVLFEEAAGEDGVLSDVPGSVYSEESWSSGEVHESLREGEIIRIEADIQILDPSFFSARLARFNDFADHLISLITAEGSVNLNKQQLKQAKTRARKELWGDTDPKMVERISALISSFLADSIAIRVLPCGASLPEISFGGVLLGRREYIQEEREALFSRYGSLLRGWSAVLQIATIPGPPSSEGGEDVFEDLELTTSRNEIQRAALESAGVRLIGLLETMGFSEGPRWPSISTTPLAIYREVPRAE